jgi:hypothetical protein
VLDDVIDGALEVLRKKSKNDLYYNDPVLWAEEVLGAELWSKQKDMLMSLAQNKRTAVKSAHSTGKSYTMGIAACWWISTRGPNSLVVSTAPTYNQVHNILWEEIRKHYVENGLPGKITQDDQWKTPVEGIDDKGNKRIIEKQIAFGRRPADMDFSAFQGLHRPDGVMFLIDEAVGCPEMIFTAAEVNTTAENCRILAIANPDDVQTAFGRIFKQNDPTWTKLTISAHDTPNFTGEPVSEKLASLLPQVQWVEDMKILAVLRLRFWLSSLKSRMRCFSRRRTLTALWIRKCLRIWISLAFWVSTLPVWVTTITLFTLTMRVVCDFTASGTRLR